MKITYEILAALRDAVERAGGSGELARRCGINPANLSRYLNGKVHTISDDNWAKLSPCLRRSSPRLEVREESGGWAAPSASAFAAALRRAATICNTAALREFIKDAMLRHGVRDATELCRRIGYDSTTTVARLLTGELNWFPEVLSALFDALELDPAAAPLAPGERELLAPRGIYNDGAMLVRPIPVVDWANAASHLETVCGGETLMKRWDPETTETVPIPVGSRSDIQAFRVAGISMEPLIQDGDILFVEPVRDFDEIPDRRIVVAKFRDDRRNGEESVVCKRFRREGKTCLLTSDNPAGRVIPFVPADLAWIGIVVRKITDLL